MKAAHDSDFALFSWDVCFWKEVKFLNFIVYSSQ